MLRKEKEGLERETESRRTRMSQGDRKIVGAGLERRNDEHPPNLLPEKLENGLWLGGDENEGKIPILLP